MGCYCPRATAYVFKRQHPNTHPPIGDHRGLPTRAKAAESPVRGSICLESPDLGRFWGGAYMYRSVCGTPPLAIWPLGTRNWWWMAVRFYYNLGRPSHGLLTPCHPPNGENTNDWYLIADGNIDLNKCSHLWAISKSIGSMKNTIVNSGNIEKGHCTWREKNLP